MRLNGGPWSLLVVTVSLIWKERTTFGKALGFHQCFQVFNQDVYRMSVVEAKKSDWVAARDLAAVFI